MSVRGRSWKMNVERGISSDSITLTRKTSINKKNKKNKENLSDEKVQTPPSSVGAEPIFFKSEAKKSEGLESLPSTSPAPAA